jgi:hypothetical protein
MQDNTPDSEIKNEEKTKSVRIQILEILLQDKTRLDIEIIKKLGKKRTADITKDLVILQKESYIEHFPDRAAVQEKYRSTLKTDWATLTKLYVDGNYEQVRTEVRKYCCNEFIKYLERDIDPDIFKIVPKMILLSPAFFDIIRKYNSFEEFLKVHESFFSPLDTVGVNDEDFKKSWLLYQLFAQSVIIDELNDEEGKEADMILKSINELIATKIQNTRKLAEYQKIVSFVLNSLRLSNDKDKERLKEICVVFNALYEEKIKDKQPTDSDITKLEMKFYGIGELFAKVFPLEQIIY